MPKAARVNDPTGHGKPLGAGPGSTTVSIGFMPAWRALPASVGAAVESASNKINQFMTTPVLTPASSADKIAQICQGLTESGAKAAAEGNPAGASAVGSALPTVISTNVALTTAWGTASAAPGGQPAANEAYTKGITAAVAAAASAVFSAIGGMADMHICPIPTPVPPHGPGMVCKASETVFVDNLPLARVGDQVMEACGGGNPIQVGCPTVDVG